jgi:hypothetical protein
VPQIVFQKLEERYPSSALARIQSNPTQLCHMVFSLTAINIPDSKVCQAAGPVTSERDPIERASLPGALGRHSVLGFRRRSDQPSVSLPERPGGSRGHAGRGGYFPSQADIQGTHSHTSWLLLCAIMHTHRPIHRRTTRWWCATCDDADSWSNVFATLS